MALDLTLGVIDPCGGAGHEPDLYTRVPVSCRMANHVYSEQLLARLPTTAAPTVKWYGDDGLLAVTRDPYGSPLVMSRAGELAPVLQAAVEPDKPWDAASAAFVAAMPPETQIVLWYR